MSTQVSVRPSPIVIGVGNPWRGDDGAGPAVARRVATRLGSADVDVVEVDGEPARLVELWTGRVLAVVIDAVCGGRAPGELEVVELASGRVPELGGSNPPGGSHALGIADAVRLAEVLDRMPTRLVVVGIAGSRFDHTPGPALDPAVAAAVDRAATLVVELCEAERRGIGRGAHVPEQ